MSEKRKLKPKQEQFCQYFTTHWNATRAAKEAKYSEKTAMEQGYQLLQNPSVQARIAELTEHSLKEIGVSRERVLSELAYIAFLDPSDAYDNLGQLLPIKEMPESVRRVVSKVKIFEQFGKTSEGEKDLIGFTKEVEFAPKKAALDSLAKHLRLLPDSLEHSGKDGKPIDIRNTTELPDDQLDQQIQKLLSKSQTTEPTKP